MTSTVPKVTKALVINKGSADRKPVYHDVVLEERPIPELKDGQIIVKVNAVAFNHRDLWIRKGLYPGIGFGSTLGADGVGIVIAAANNSDPLLNKRVFFTPMRGWENDPDAPESPQFTVVGGNKLDPFGTFAEYVVVDRHEVIPAPEYLDDEHVAAWPLGGLTAWRALVINAQVQTGHNVLVTGIGGGVALLALQLALAHGANVYVTSGSKEKIDKAIALGAKGGVNYKDKDWPAQLEGLLTQNSGKGARLNSVIDSGGADIVAQAGKVLKNGGRIVIYGMTASSQTTFSMREVLKNQRVLGSTMGSRQDLIDATEFLAKHRFTPVVSHVLEGLESADEGFELVERGVHFGKVVIRVQHEADKSSKL